MSEVDDLLREIDALAARHDYEGIIALAERAKSAGERGRQLWPAAEHAYYRVALHGPAPLAALAVTRCEGRFSLGPLTEVVAQNHTWAELRPHLGDTLEAAVVAHERVIRGEDLRSDASLADVDDVPLRLQPWEPKYVTPTYSEFAIVDEPPPLPELSPASPRSGKAHVIDYFEPTEDALGELTRHWSTQSNGRTEVVAVEGSAADAIAALGPTRVRMAPLEPREALAQMAWAAATGAAAGRRRGASAGRFDAWWVGCELAELDWPPDPKRLGERLAEFDWYAWDAYEPAVGWHLRLAVADLIDGIAWAVIATDQR